MTERWPWRLIEWPRLRGARARRGAGSPGRGPPLTFTEALAEVGLESEASPLLGGTATLGDKSPRRSPSTRPCVRVVLARPPARRGPCCQRWREVTIAVEVRDGREQTRRTIEEAPPLVVRASAVELLRAKDFAACSSAELDETHRLLADLRFTRARSAARAVCGPFIVHGHHAGAHLDCAQTVRRSLRAGGEPSPARPPRSEHAPLASRVPRRRERVDGSVHRAPCWLLRARGSRRRPPGGDLRLGQRGSHRLNARLELARSRRGDARAAHVVPVQLVGRHPPREASALSTIGGGTRRRSRAVVVIRSDGWDETTLRCGRTDGSVAPRRLPHRLVIRSRPPPATNRLHAGWLRPCRSSTNSSGHSRIESLDHSRTSLEAGMKELLTDIAGGGARESALRLRRRRSSRIRATRPVRGDGGERRRRGRRSVSGGCVEGAVVNGGPPGPRIR